MTVKRYDTRIGSSMGLNVPCSEMYANPVGQFVTYSDYQKLVAENAAMRKAIDETIGWQESVDLGNTESVRLLVALQTPATEAFTAELRAQGVDEYAQAFSENTNMDFACNRGFYHGALDFSANLRAGRKG